MDLTKNWLTGYAETNVVMRQFNTPIVDAPSMLGAVQEHWHGITFLDIVDICHLARQEALKIYVYREDPGVHFSLFGRDRILLQEPQRDASELKLVWYLQSEGLVDLLMPAARMYVKESQRINPVSFDTLAAWLTTESVTTVILEGKHPRPSFESLPPQEQEMLLKTGFVKYNQHGDARLRRIPRGYSEQRNQVQGTSASATATVDDAEASNEVFLLAPADDSRQEERAIVAEVLEEEGYQVKLPTQSFIHEAQIRQALKAKGIISIVSSVGTAAETMHLMHCQRIESIRPGISRTSIPHICVLVPSTHIESVFSRLLIESYHAQVISIPPRSSAAMDGAKDLGAILREVLTHWSGPEDVVLESAIASSQERQMDEISRRDQTRGQTTWMPYE